MTDHMEDFEKLKRSFPLHCAVLDRDERTISSLLSQGYSVNAVYEGMTPLMIAVVPRISPIFPINLFDNIPVTPQKYDPALGVVKTLLQHGARVSDRNANGETVLHCAVQNPTYCDIITCLVQNGTEINSKDFRGRTPLHVLCKSRPPTPLVCSKLNLEPTTEKEAFQRNKVKVARFLIEYGADLSALDHFSYTPIDMAVIFSKSDVELFQVFLDQDVSLTDDIHVSDNGSTLLHRLFLGQMQDPEVLATKIRILTKNGIDVNVQNSFGMTPLHYACLHNPDFIDLDEISVKTLTTMGADVNKQDSLGRTPLHHLISHKYDNCYYFSCKKKRSAIFLLQSGASVNIRDIFGCTPLHYAVIESNHLNYVQFLVESGADLGIQDMHGATPLHYAASYGNLKAFDILLKGLDIKITNLKDAYASSLLHYSVLKNSQELTKMLLQAGIQRNDEDGEDFTPLARARQHGFVDILSVLSETPSHTSTSDEQTLQNVLEIPCSSSLKPLNPSDALSGNLQMVSVPKDLPSFCESVIKSPVIGCSNNHEDSVIIVEEVTKFIQNVAILYKNENPLLKFEPVLRGSTMKGTKCGPPDEFDFMLVMSEMEELFDVHENSSETNRGFVSLTCKEQARNSDLFRSMPYLLTRRGHLNCAKIAFILCQTLKDIFRRNSTWVQTKFAYLGQVELHSVAMKLTLQWTGQCFKQLHISIDLVPCIKLSRFKPTYMKKDYPVSVDLNILPLYVLFAHSSNNENDEGLFTYELSYTSVEATLMNQLPKTIKLAYVLAKAMRSKYVCPEMLDINEYYNYREWDTEEDETDVKSGASYSIHDSDDEVPSSGITSSLPSSEDISFQEVDPMITDWSSASTVVQSYLLKTAMFHEITCSKIDLVCVNSENPTDIVKWTQRIYKNLHEGLKHNHMPSYFDGQNLLDNKRTNIEHVTLELEMFDRWKTSAMIEAHRRTSHTQNENESVCGTLLPTTFMSCHALYDEQRETNPEKSEEETIEFIHREHRAFVNVIKNLLHIP